MRVCYVFLNLVGKKLTLNQKRAMKDVRSHDRRPKTTFMTLNSEGRDFESHFALGNFSELSDVTDNCFF